MVNKLTPIKWLFVGSKCFKTTLSVSETIPNKELDYYKLEGIEHI